MKCCKNQHIGKLPGCINELICMCNRLYILKLCLCISQVHGRGLFHVSPWALRLGYGPCFGRGVSVWRALRREAGISPTVWHLGLISRAWVGNFCSRCGAREVVLGELRASSSSSVSFVGVRTSLGSEAVQHWPNRGGRARGFPNTWTLMPEQEVINDFYLP